MHRGNVPAKSIAQRNCAASPYRLARQHTEHIDQTGFANGQTRTDKTSTARDTRTFMQVCPDEFTLPR